MCEANTEIEPYVGADIVRPFGGVAFCVYFIHFASQNTILSQPSADSPFAKGAFAACGRDEGYSAARVVFGAEPTDAQLYEWLEREWHRLRFSPSAEGERPVTERGNPKRIQREARAVTQTRGVSTRAQETLSRQREQEGLTRQSRSRQAKQEEAERKYLLRQQKKREKKRGR